MKKTLEILLKITLIGVVLASLMGYLGGLNWILELFSHFRVQYSIILSLLLIPFVIKKKKILITLGALALIINAVEVSSIYFGGSKDTSLNQTLKICSINVLSYNNEFDLADQYIKSKQPDIVVIQELSKAWGVALAQRLSDYPYSYAIPRAGNFGIAVYSKVKMDGLKTLAFVIKEVPSILCTFEFEQQEVSLIVTHPLPPMNELNAVYRNAQLDSIAKRTSTGGNYIVIGDLNISPYSPHFKNMLREGSLVDTRKGFGILGSWPTWSPLPIMTIDHCLISPKLRVKKREVGDYVGSDHLPVYVEIGL